MKSVLVSQGARQDLKELADWYEAAEPGLARQFRQAFEQAMQRMTRYPAAGTLWAHGARWLRLPQFPVKPIYRETPNALQVLAVAHNRRAPNYWIDR
jgi:plasmid stabilization system protein ParE